MPRTLSDGVEGIDVRLEVNIQMYSVGIRKWSDDVEGIDVRLEVNMTRRRRNWRSFVSSLPRDMELM